MDVTCQSSPKEEGWERRRRGGKTVKKKNHEPVAILSAIGLVWFGLAYAAEVDSFSPEVLFLQALLLYCDERVTGSTSTFVRLLEASVHYLYVSGYHFFRVVASYHPLLRFLDRFNPPSRWE